MYSKVLIALLAGAVTVSAHGYVEKLSINGKTYNGYNPTYAGDVVNRNTPSWANGAEETEFVDHNNFQNPDIICHKGAANAKQYATVTAGDTIELQWTSWDISHKGPVLDYLADCSGDCTAVEKTALKWVKIAEQGRLGPGGETGVWATDKFREAGLKWKVTIPASLAPGKYVLRHELVALHEINQPQMYPQCINLEVKGSGSAHLEGGVVGTSLYQRQDPGLDLNIYFDKLSTTYQIPGPRVWYPSPANGAHETSSGTAPVQSATTLSAVVNPTGGVIETPTVTFSTIKPKPTCSNSVQRRSKHGRRSHI